MSFNLSVALLQSIYEDSSHIFNMLNMISALKFACFHRQLPVNEREMEGSLMILSARSVDSWNETCQIHLMAGDSYGNWMGCSGDSFFYTFPTAQRLWG
jgi:hypothetical protein